MIKILVLMLLLTQGDEFPGYSQRDVRWSGEGLGGTQYSMHWNGCFITSVAMMVSHRYDQRITPSDAHKALREGGAMYGYITDITKVDDVYPGVQLMSLTGVGAWFNERMIDVPLKNGHYVFVGVDAIPSTARIEPHWMLIVGGENGDYVAHNPWAWPGYHRMKFPGYYSKGGTWSTIMSLAVFRRQ